MKPGGQTGPWRNLTVCTLRQHTDSRGVATRMCEPVVISSRDPSAAETHNCNHGGVVPSTHGVEVRGVDALAFGQSQLASTRGDETEVLHRWWIVNEVAPQQTV